ncbi:MAG: SH3 domain-containing protein [Anaerolineales bacterium]|nr:SH3 domain-containing protein [Anaerolineales bacterium]
MRFKPTFALAFTALLAAIFACNFPSAPQPLTDDVRAMTVIAATFQEDLQHGLDVPITATFSLTPNPTSTTNPNAPTATITPTFSTPTLKVIEQTNCRTGPGQDYEVVFTYLPNKKLEILGRYDIENYWLVKSAESPTGQCWLWGEYVEVSGSYWTVASVTPPPTATKAPPNAPSFQSWDYTCTYNGINNDLTVTLTWSDKSNNETGYRVFRDGGLVADLPAGSSAYADKVAVNSGQGVGYRVDAYNVTGTASTSTISITCP